MEDGSSAQIVVIDDNPDDIYLFQRILRKAGASNPVQAFESSRAALAWLLEHPTEVPGIIFLDIKMPVISGFEILERARAAPWLAAVPIIMLSGSAAAVDVEKATHLGATAYLVKPPGVEQVQAVLRGEFSA